MLALIGNLDLLELVLIAAVALMVFGKRLPEVTMRGAAQLMKLRREVARMWREAGLEEELRKVRRDIEREVPKHLPTPEQLVRQAELELEAERGASPEEVGAVGPRDPLDPLSREALAAEPQPDESAQDEALQHETGPGEEDAMGDPLLQARVEPQGDEDSEPDGPHEDAEKESA